MSERQEINLLKISNLSVGLKSAKTKSLILDNINLAININQRVALIGQSGSGKTITSRAILGLLPESMKVLNGSMFYGDRQIQLGDESAFNGIRGKKVTMIFQEPHAALNPVFQTGTQLTDVIKTNLHVPKKIAREYALDILAQVGFKDIRQVYKMYPGQLSGGMAQRVLIAMAISCEPELIIADEPTSALDAITQNKIFKLIFDLQEKKRFAILMISHDIPLIRKYVDDVYILKDGKMVFKGMISDLPNPNPDPYIQSLLETLPEIH